MVQTKVRGANGSKDIIVKAHCRRQWRSQVAAAEPAATAAASVIVAMATFAEMASEPAVAAARDEDYVPSQPPPTMTISMRQTTKASLPPTTPTPTAATATRSTVIIASLISQAREYKSSLAKFLLLILLIGLHVVQMPEEALAKLYDSPIFPLDELRVIRRVRDSDNRQQQLEILNNNSNSKTRNEPVGSSSSSDSDNSRESRNARLRQWVRALNETLDEKSLEAFIEISEQGKGKSLLFESKILNQDELYGRIVRENMTRKYEGNLYAWKIGHIVLMQNETAILVVCASIPRYYYWEFAQTASTVVIFCMIIVGNLSVLHRLKSCRRRRSNVNYFIVQLAIADLFVGFFSVTLDSLWRFQKMFAYGPVACRASKYISVLFIYSSTYLLVALSIDRWEAVVKPLAFTRNRSRGYYLVLGAWLLAFVGATPVTLHTTIKDVEGLPQCFIDLTQRGWKIYMVYLTCSLLVVPALIIAICYTHIVFTIWSKGRLVQKQQKRKLKEEKFARKKKQNSIETTEGERRSSIIINNNTTTNSSNNDPLTVALGTSDTTVATIKLSSSSGSDRQQQEQQQQQQKRGQRRRHLGSQQRRRQRKQNPDVEDNGTQTNVCDKIVKNYDDDSLSQFTEDEYLSSSDDYGDEEMEDEEDEYDYYDNEDEEEEQEEEAVEASTAAPVVAVGTNYDDGGGDTAGHELVGRRGGQLDGKHDNELELCEMVGRQIAPGDTHANRRVSVRIRQTPTVVNAGGGGESTKRNSTRAGQETRGVVFRDLSQVGPKLEGATKTGIRTTSERTKTSMMTAAQRKRQPLIANRTNSSAAASITINHATTTGTSGVSGGGGHQMRKRLSKGAKKARRSYTAGQQHGSGVIPKARIKTIKMTLVIVAVFVLCWAPFYIINLCSVFGLMPKDTSFAFAIKTLSQSLAHLNSAVNPIIFWMFSSKQRGKTVVVSSAADVRNRLNIAPEKG